MKTTRTTLDNGLLFRKNAKRTKKAKTLFERARGNAQIYAEKGFLGMSIK